ncbi:MAG: hypothetical protein Tsb007_35580 [Rhizobacter sp.]
MLMPQETHLPDLSLLCSPQVVALVGASDDPSSIGGRALIKLLLHSAFKGELMLVNPKREQVAGRRCWPDVASLPTTPDMVMVSVPAVQVNAVLRQCAARGVRFAIVFSSGFGEAGPEGQRLEAEMAGARPAAAAWARHRDLLFIGWRLGTHRRPGGPGGHPPGDVRGRHHPGTG